MSKTSSSEAASSISDDSNLSLVGSPSIMNMEACPFQKMKIDGIATNIKKKSYNALYYDLYGSRALFRLANVYLLMIHSHVIFRKEKRIAEGIF